MFGPPEGFTPPSTCPWVDHQVSRLPPATRRPFRTRFPFGSVVIRLNLATESNSQAHYAKGTRSPANGLPQLVSTRFQVLFTPLIGVLFIIQSPYWFTIGRPGVLSLGGWTPHVHAEFHEHRATLGLASYCSTGLSPSVVHLSRWFTQLLVYPLSLAATYGVAFAFLSSGY